MTYFFTEKNKRSKSRVIPRKKSISFFDPIEVLQSSLVACMNRLTLTDFIADIKFELTIKFSCNLVFPRDLSKPEAQKVVGGCESINLRFQLD